MGVRAAVQMLMLMVMVMVLGNGEQITAAAAGRCRVGGQLLARRRRGGGRMSGARVGVELDFVEGGGSDLNEVVE